MNFKSRLKQLRAERGITQDQLAEALDIPSSSIRRLESDEDSLPRKERLELIADYFNVSVDYLIGRIEERQGETAPSKLTPQELAIRDLVRRYNIDISQPGAMEKLERMVQIVFEDIDEKSKNK